MTNVSPRCVCLRPETPPGFEFVTFNVSAGGEGLFLYVGDDGGSEVHARRDAPGFASFPKPSMPSAKPFKLAIFSEGALRWIDLPPCDVAFPQVEIFPDGRILLAAARCAWRGPEDFDRNGVIINPASGGVERILLGDGIADLAIDALGRIWVGYIDEGVFGNFGWSHPGPPGPGQGGLVCFNDRGEALWCFNRADGEAAIDECYAMNATRDEIWIYYYSDFKICHVGSDFFETFYTPEDVSGSGALTVSKTAVLLSSQYQESRDTFHLLRRVGDQLAAPQPLHIKLPNGASMERAQIIGRGQILNILSDEGWFRLDLDELVS